jgi:hypothetical protein
MGCELKVELSIGNVRNESNLYLKGDVNSNTLVILKFSFWEKYYDAFSQD